jgi:hypothetical protein
METSITAFSLVLRVNQNASNKFSDTTGRVLKDTSL